MTVWGSSLEYGGNCGGQTCFVLQMYDVIANNVVYQLNWALKIDRKLAGSDCARK